MCINQHASSSASGSRVGRSTVDACTSSVDHCHVQRQVVSNDHCGSAFKFVAQQSCEVSDGKLPFRIKSVVSPPSLSRCKRFCQHPCWCPGPLATQPLIAMLSDTTSGCTRSNQHCGSSSCVAHLPVLFDPEAVPSSRSGTRCADPRLQSCFKNFCTSCNVSVAGGRDVGHTVHSKLPQHHHRVWINCDAGGVNFSLLWNILHASFTFLLLQLH